MLGLRKRTWIIAGVVAALIGTAAVAGRYHHRGHSPEDRADWATYMVTKRLELTDEQQASFDKIAQSYVELMSTRRSFMSDMAGKAKELAQGDNLTVEDVNALRGEISAEFDRRADVLVPQLVAFYNTLDDEQKAKVAQRLDRMSERAGRRWNRDRD